MTGESEIQAFATDNLSLAAYLKMRGKKMTGYETARAKVIFYFDDEDGQCERMYVEFLNSDIKRFDSEVRDLKKLFKKRA